MKTVILAGGFGTRISEQSHLIPKPMIEIGGMPILWHIMKYYSTFGHTDFIICCGYKQYVIKEFFADYYLHTSDVTFDFSSGNKMTVHANKSEPWKVTIVDTGLHTATGGRIKRVRDYIGEESFMMTYGDGLADININQLIDFHKKRKTIATITAVQPGGRFGMLDIQDDHQITSFKEKSKEDGGWVNGGFMVLEPEVMSYISGDDIFFEREPLEKLSQDQQLMAYRHEGFWQCMDTLKDKELLERRWALGDAPWKAW